jgi:hypothetical protein
MHMESRSVMCETLLPSICCHVMVVGHRVSCNFQQILNTLNYRWVIAFNEADILLHMNCQLCCITVHVRLILAIKRFSPACAVYGESTDWFRGSECFLRWWFVRWSTYQLSFTEPEGSLSCLQTSATELYLDSYLSSSHHPHTLFFKIHILHSPFWRKISRLWDHHPVSVCIFLSNF